MAADLLRASRELVENNEASRVSDEAVAQILTAAIRLYVAKSDGEERTFAPIAGRNDSELTPTELLSAVSEMLRAMRLGPMELALWYRRRPGRRHLFRGREIMNIQGRIGPQYSAIQEITVHTDTRDILAHAQAQRDPARPAGLVRLRHRRPSRRDGLVEGDRHLYRGPRRARQRDPVPERAARRPALRAERRPWAALSIGRRAHPAPGRPARDRRGDRRASRRRADAPRDGLARHRQHGGVPDADAVSGHASAAGNGGLARQRL